MTYRVSVVVPCHNHANLLGQALDSIAAQNVAGVEIIVVNDSSTDNTVAVASEHGVAAITSRGRGAAAARNTGIVAATGDLLAFLDADDLWTPNSLAVRLAGLGANDGVFGAVDEFIEPGFDDASARPRSVGPTRMAGSMLTTRHAWAVVGPLNESLPLGEFMDWVARFDNAGLHASTVDSVVLRRRLHTSNTTRVAASVAATSYLEVARLHRRRQAS